ncbi:hypothetical protein MMC17_002424 [Xylographa soralifera]|nr:hypothetical protein [Xylographa soralifera]
MELSTRRRRRGDGSSEEAYAGPLQSSIPSPPQTPAYKRVRRALTSSEEMPVVEGDIKSYDFRCGGPVLCSLPASIMEVEESSLAAQLWPELEGAVESILKKRQVDYGTIMLRHRFWRYDIDNSRTDTATVFVSATKNGENDRWLELCQDLRRLFISRGLSSLNIEIADRRGLLETISGIVEPSQPIVMLWPKLEIDVEQILGKRDWVILALLRRGTDSDSRKNPITISITISEDSTSDWVSVREKIVQLLDQRQLPYLAVEITRGRIDYAVSNREFLSEKSYEIPAKMGRSIGPHDFPKSSGTLGGFVKLQNAAGQWRTFGLTCYHCVAPESMHISNRLLWEQKGIRPNDAGHILDLDQPSLADHEETLGYQDEVIERLQSPQFYEIEKRLADPNDFVLPYISKEHQVTKDQIQGLQLQQNASRQFFKAGNQLLGTVFVASGFRQKGPSSRDTGTLDWALISINAKRASTNILPESEAIVNSRARIEFSAYSVKDKNGVLQPELVKGAQLPIAGTSLFKFGRSTDFTMGLYSGVGQCLIQSWKQGPDGKLIQSTGRDHMVISGPVHDPIHFSRSGDSGAFVMDRRGNLIGLLFGGNPGNKVSFFTSAADLFEDIKLMTGAVDVDVA